MSSKYNVIKQNNDNYDIFQIKTSNGKKCIFWKKKDAKDINEVVTIFNNDSVSAITDKQMFLSFHGVTLKEDIDGLMVAFGTEAYKNGLDITKVNFKFVVDNKEEEDLVNDFMKKYRLKGNVTHSEKYSQLTENLEDAISKIATNSEDNQIVKEDNDEIKKYTIHEDKVYSDNDTLSIAEKKRILLSTWRHDPIKAKEIYNLSREELDKMLTEAVTSSLKVNNLEEPINSDNLDDNFSKVSNDKAISEDGRVNRDLGIIKNNPEKENKFSVVEKDGENLNIVNPTVYRESIDYTNNIYKSNDNSAYHVDTVTTGVDSSFWDDDDLGSINRDVVESRDDDLPVYYVGDKEKIYNQYGKFVGINEVGGKQIVGDKLTSTVNGEVIGQIDSIDNMERNINKPKGKVRVYKPKNKNTYSRDNDSGKISLPIIIFIISLFLLIGSGVILYFMK